MHRCSERTLHGPLARYVKLRVRMRRECRERFPRHRRWAIPTCITARASRTCRDACRDRQLSVSFEIGGGGKRSRHSRRMRNLQFYVSGKRPMMAKHKWIYLWKLAYSPCCPLVVLYKVSCFFGRNQFNFMINEFYWWYLGPFYWHILILIPVWISNRIYHKMWDGIT